MMELFHSPRSTCSQKVRLCFAEKKQSFMSRLMDLGKAEHLTPEYLRINPNGVVPSLLHDGQAVLDSSVICEYLEEVFPEPALAPASSIGRAQMRAWMRYLEEVPTSAIRVPTFNQIYAERMKTISGEEFERWTAKLPLRKAFYRKMGRDGFSSTDTQDSLDRLAQTVQRADAALKRGPWLLGEQFTIADIVLTPTIVRMDDLGLGYLWKEYPQVAGWYDRIQQRPSFKIAYFEGTRMDRQFGYAGLPQ
jgi:glutathione S-transferase